MDPIHLLQLIQQGESREVEFKRCRSALNRDVYESICALLNRQGGHLFLGVADNTEVTGVEEGAVATIVNQLATALNNPQKLSPPFYLSPEVVELDGKVVVYLRVPESSQVHRTVNRIFDRNDDGDLDITDHSAQVAQLYQRKQATYSENTIYPYAELADFRPDLLERARIRAKNENGGSHPWFEMDDETLLKSAQLYKQDRQAGTEGYTLAGILLFGTDDAILSVLPHHRTDAILRRVNLDRYDDRDDIRTNLLESYDRLMAFVAKHLPDPFYLEGDVRMSLRNKIFREAVANCLIHREFTNGFPAKMVLEQDRVLFENANRPQAVGEIDPSSFTPFPKNPIIARVFKELGFADELGSGVRNLYKYTGAYAAGREPHLLEEDIFRVLIPVGEEVLSTDQATGEVTGEVERKAEILSYCLEPRSANEIMSHLGLRHKEHFRLSLLKPLLEQGGLLMTLPDKPTSSKQQYYSKVR